MQRFVILVCLLAVPPMLGACGDDSTAPPDDAGSGTDSSRPRDTGAGTTDSGGGTDSALPDECSGGPLAAPIAGCRPTPVPDTGDIYADCVARINQFRAECQCLPPLEQWTAGEGCADQHAEYDSTRSAHAAFNARICENGGNAQNECPGWGGTGQVIDGCLQLMWDEGPGEPFSAHGHYINMSSTSYSRVACGFYAAPDGSTWSVQNFQ